jgi:anti-sigma B factor antagonist
MANFHATLERSRSNPALYVVSASGRLDASGIPVLSDRLAEVRGAPRPRVIFDLAKLAFVGSAGIGLFLSFVEELRDAGGDARFVNVPQSVSAVLALLNVTEFLTQASSADSAAAELCA